MSSVSKIIKSVFDEDAISARVHIRESLYKRAGVMLSRRPSECIDTILCENCACTMQVDEQSEEQKAFRDLFDRILKKYKVGSPNELDDSKKDDFFNEVEREWKKDPKNDNKGEGEADD
jgi:hypothetical protein